MAVLKKVFALPLILLAAVSLSACEPIDVGVNAKQDSTSIAVKVNADDVYSYVNKSEYPVDGVTSLMDSKAGKDICEGAVGVVSKKANIEPSRIKTGFVPAQPSSTCVYSFTIDKPLSEINIGEIENDAKVTVSSTVLKINGVSSLSFELKKGDTQPTFNLEKQPVKTAIPDKTILPKKPVTPTKPQTPPALQLIKIIAICAFITVISLIAGIWLVTNRRAARILKTNSNLEEELPIFDSDPTKVESSAMIGWSKDKNLKKRAERW